MYVCVYVYVCICMGVWLDDRRLELAGPTPDACVCMCVYVSVCMCVYVCEDPLCQRPGPRLHAVAHLIMFIRNVSSDSLSSCIYIVPF